MWIVLAFLSAIFAGLTSIFAKIGLKKVDSNLATALRTIVVLIFTWIMVLIVGGCSSFKIMTAKNYIFIVLSGLATGFSWICYFKALQMGDVNKVVPIDKSSTILTIILAFIIFGEKLKIYGVFGLILLSIGTFLMIEKKESTSTESRSWFIYAVLAAVFASLTSILAKVGMKGINSQLGTALRTGVVIIMAWIIVFAQKKHHQISDIDKRSWLFIILSGLATGLSWIAYFKALQDGQASVVVPIDKLSILISMGFSYFVLKEKFTKRSVFGLFLLTIGTLLLII